MALAGRFLGTLLPSGVVQNAVNEWIKGDSLFKSLITLLVGATVLAAACLVFLSPTTPLRQTAAYVRLPDGLIALAIFWPPVALGATWALLRGKSGHLVLAIVVGSLLTLGAVLFGCSAFFGVLSLVDACSASNQGILRAFFAMLTAPLFLGAISGRFQRSMLP
ncbi:hypothetical protein FNJ84_08815 [Paracoccus sp. M683]|uniref:hypothetical protein n=1 Tax=Paracoccus sp. M683 TaxID=2594268 RepID=UPI00117BF21D|nr:hypothetical protein [Paracoccus sp. M683]TRW97595.1 hypothetical protein FNJ84_08815 [Paracoccus sp. M683]